MFKYLLVFSLLLSAGHVAGQGWERVFNGGGTGQINGIVMTADGGFAMIAPYNALNRARLLKTDADGQLQWTRDYFLDTQTSGEAIIIAKDGGYVIAGFLVDVNSVRKAYLMKTDALGQVEWTTVFPGNGANAEALDVVELANENAYVVCGYQKENLKPTEDVLTFKVDAGGSIIWSNTFGLENIQEKGFAISLDVNGDLLIAGERRVVSGASDIYVIHVSSDSGAPNWEMTHGLGVGSNDVAYDVVGTNDGNYVIAGYSNLDPGGLGILMKFDGQGNSTPIWDKRFSEAIFYGLDQTQDGIFYATGSRASTFAQEELFIAQTNAQGDILCEVSVGRPGVDRGFGIVATPDGGAVAAGFGEQFIANPFPEESLYMVKTDKNCVVFTSYIAGHIFHDFNTNCIRDGNEPSLEDWIVRIESPNFTRYAAANANGDFLLTVDTGIYTIKLFPPSNAWKSCDQAITLPVTAFSDTFSIDIPVKAALACPRNEVDIATPVLRRCTDNQYTVRYCNSGTIASVNTQIVVTLDPELEFITSSAPVIQGPNNTFIFDVGFLQIGDCRSFTIDAFLNCDVEVDETYCARAHIYPDTFCNVTTGWDGSIVEAQAICDGDTIRMVLGNVGSGPMLEGVGFVIAEDVIMLTAPGDPQYKSSPLPVGGQEVVWKIKSSGKTYRIISEQRPGYPGTSYPTAAVERCVSDTSSVGYYTMFPEDEAEPFKAADCQETYDTDYNPNNLKRGHPKGYGAVSHYITPQTDLEFLIQFQNSGTDTVHQVIIRDTLSGYLDPSMVHPGAASHPYDFDVYGPGIVQFTLPNLNLLPDSGANEGFVTFRVSQKAQVPCNSEILNSAAIYLDFNAPVLTNQTFHTVCEFDTFVVVKTKHIDFAGADVKVYPNPFDVSAVFEISGVSAAGFDLELYDLQGKKVFNQSYNHSTFRLYRNQLPAGMFFYRLITNKGQPVASGKLLVR